MKPQGGPAFAHQLALPLTSAPRYGRADFLTGKANALAFEQITRWPHWLSSAMVLCGPEGSGKTHLGAVFAQISGARIIRGDHITLEAVPQLAHGPALVLEDCDRFLPQETALFHLLNLIRETGTHVLITARLQPDHWGVTTPDLLSRLRACPLLGLAEPDDAMLGALFVKLFADRQVEVEANVITYAMARAPRSYAGVIGLIEALDQLSLTRKKPISRALVAECLGLAGLEDEEA